MRTSCPNPSECLRNAGANLLPPATSARRGKLRSFSSISIVCLLPARDVVIDFGKYKGCKLGTLPSRYLQWLIRESHQPSLAAWGDYAQQVLQDPHYKDRLEWQSIERLVSRGDMRKGGPLGSSAGAKDSMAALGWDLSNAKSWSNVNFSLLGTTEGGRIPRKESASAFSSIKPAASKPAPGLPGQAGEARSSGKSVVKRPSRSTLDGSLSSVKAAIEARMNAVTVSKFPDGDLDGSVSSLKAAKMNIAQRSKPLAADSALGDAQPAGSLTLQEEVLRRRQLRRERATRKSLISLPPTTNKVENLFPGRESLLKRVRNLAETEL